MRPGASVAGGSCSEEGDPRSPCQSRLFCAGYGDGTGVCLGYCDTTACPDETAACATCPSPAPSCFEAVPVYDANGQFVTCPLGTCAAGQWCVPVDGNTPPTRWRFEDHLVGCLP